MLPFHKGERITTTAGGATLTGFSATVKGASADAPEAPRRKGGHLPYAQFVTDSGRFGAVRYAALRPEELPGHQLRAGDVIRLSDFSKEEVTLERVVVANGMVVLHYTNARGERVKVSQPGLAEVTRVRKAKR